MTYLCPRCGYSNDIKTKMENHITRIHMCQPLLSDVDVKKLHILNFKISKETNKPVRPIPDDAPIYIPIPTPKPKIVDKEKKKPTTQSLSEIQSALSKITETLLEIKGDKEPSEKN